MRKILLTTTLALAAMCCQAQKTMKAPAGGTAISDELIGIFFEDISSSADGGLCAELIQNGSFEYNPTERDGWGPGTAWHMVRPGHSLGYMMPQMANPLNKNNPTYMRLHTERVKEYYDYDGWKGFGLQNDGYDGIVVKAGEKYDFSVFLRSYQPMQLRVVLMRPGRKWEVLAETTLEVDSPAWQQYATTLVPTEDCDHAALMLLSLTVGDVDVDMVSLYPEDTYKGHGLRKDLVQALADLKPAFMRFPGGCVVHGGGDGFWNTYRWKQTIGPREQRYQQKNCWGYHQSLGLGYYEYFQLCEDIDMEPLPILPVGVSCQGANGGWGMREQAQDVKPLDEMQEWIDDALDLIEWANGDVNTTWGAKRAAQGHPAPFGLKYLGLGNEERISPEFCERFKMIYDAVTAKYPDIVIVGTAGPGSHAGNSDYDTSWKFAEELGIPVLDEHYYEQKEYFLNNQHNYDKYPRTRKTKVYLGEYAAKGSTIQDALYEALYLLGIERNGDVVSMTSYAPLFAKKDHFNWRPDLIYFTNTGVVPSCNYYVQQMFGLSSGQYFYGDCVQLQDPESKFQGQSVVLNVKTRQLFVKVCNAGDEAVTAQLNLSRFGSPKKAQRMTLQGDLKAENNFDEQPIKPTVEDIKVTKKMTLDMPAHSFQLLTIQL